MSFPALEAGTRTGTRTEPEIWIDPADRVLMSRRPHQTIARDSHYVPRATLRRWSDDGTHVFAYQILVGSAKAPEWRRRAIRGLAYHRDLYTRFAGGQEVDD